MNFKKMYLLIYKYLRLQNTEYTSLFDYILKVSRLFPEIVSITFYLKTDNGLIQSNILGKPIKYTAEDITSYENLEFVYFDNTKKYIFNSKIGDLNAKILPNKLEQNKILIPIFIEQINRKPIKIGFILFSGKNLTIETTKKRATNIRDTMIFLITIFSSVSQLMYTRFDKLTSLITRKEFDFELNELLHKNPKNLSVIMLDIDYFKKVNDTYGHEAGDLVLRQFSQRILAGIRSYNRKNQPRDVVVRWGGEEFVVLLANTNTKNVLSVANRIRDNILSKEFYIGNNKKIKVTSSFGLANINQTNLKIKRKDIFKLIKFADEALYKAKETGRNKIWVYKQEDCTQKELQK